MSLVKLIVSHFHDHWEIEILVSRMYFNLQVIELCMWRSAMAMLLQQSIHFNIHNNEEDRNKNKKLIRYLPLDTTFCWLTVTSTAILEIHFNARLSDCPIV